MTEPLTDIEYEEKILNREDAVLVDFWREDCGTCQSLALELAQVAEERPELTIYKVNVNEEPELVQRLHVMMAPSLLLVKKGKTLKKSIGYKSKEHILEMLATYLDAAE